MLSVALSPRLRASFRLLAEHVESWFRLLSSNATTQERIGFEQWPDWASMWRKGRGLQNKLRTTANDVMFYWSETLQKTSNWWSWCLVHTEILLLGFLHTPSTKCIRLCQAITSGQNGVAKINKVPSRQVTILYCGIPVDGTEALEIKLYFETTPTCRLHDHNWQFMGPCLWAKFKKWVFGVHVHLRFSFFGTVQLSTNKTKVTYLSSSALTMFSYCNTSKWSKFSSDLPHQIPFGSLYHIRILQTWYLSGANHKLYHKY